MRVFVHNSNENFLQILTQLLKNLVLKRVITESNRLHFLTRLDGEGRGPLLSFDGGLK
jgi:hypothetical protein